MIHLYDKIKWSVTPIASRIPPFYPKARLTKMAKKKLSYMQRRQQQDKVNTKAIMWSGGIAVAIIILVSVLLIVNG